MAIVLKHAIHVFAQATAALIFRSHVWVEMHARAVPPAEERFVGLDLPLDEVDCSVGCLVVDRFHSLSGEWAGVLDGLHADLAEARSTVGSSLSAALDLSTPRGPNFALNAGSFG